MNPATVRIAVLGLIVLAVVCLGGIIALAITDHTTPDAIFVTLGTCVGAVGGIVAPKAAE